MKNQSMEPVTPIYTAELFSPLHQELLALLRGLAPVDWERPIRVRIEGDAALAAPLLSTRSVMV
jgi:hypothetical protein